MVRARSTRLKTMVLLAVVALTSLMSSSTSAQNFIAPQPSIVAQHGQLQVRGNRIVDQHGNPVVLRGMSLFWSQWMGKYYNRSAVKWLSDDWHCTVIRAAMGVDAGGYLTNPEQEKQKLITVVDAAIAQGIYVIIDWHDHHADQHTQASREFFAEIAERYKNSPNVIYEVWNEPLDTASWSETIKPYCETIIRTIRQHDPDNLIVCGSRSWSQRVDEASENPLKFDNVAYSLHYYAATHKQWLRDATTKALKNGIAIMVTEMGTAEASGDGKLDAEEVKTWWQFLDDNQISWCNWSLADKQEATAALLPGANSFGGWTDDFISPSGLMVRAELRQKNGVVTPTPLPKRQ